MDLRPVTAHHQGQLAAFTCATRGDDFSTEVHHSIRTEVHLELAAQRGQALGSWDGDVLAALIVYVPSSFVWVVTHLATDLRYRRRKQAERLKRDVMERARAVGAPAVSSRVHHGNIPMRMLNAKLGAVETPSDDPTNPYLICTLPLASPPHPHGVRSR